jgi:hypothetical protein
MFECKNSMAAEGSIFIPLWINTSEDRLAGSTINTHVTEITFV